MTDLTIDENLLNEAHRLGGIETKRDTLNQALEEYIQRREKKEIVNAFGKFDLDPTYNYKKERRER
jgi:Arc/MetJ family transcription regulator